MSGLLRLCGSPYLLTYLLLLAIQLLAIQFTLISFTDFILFFCCLLFLSSRSARIVLRETRCEEKHKVREVNEEFLWMVDGRDAHFTKNLYSKIICLQFQICFLNFGLISYLSTGY